MGPDAVAARVAARALFDGLGNEVSARPVGDFQAALGPEGAGLP